MKLSGWGRYPVIDAREFAPRSAREAAALTAGGTLIPRGMGRSYGDSALGENVLSTRHLDQFLAFDPDTGLLRCAAGVSLAAILDFAVPRGWFLPVTPGTKYVSVGGAIASDVHGKNHHADGCFSDHVVAMTVATAAEGVVTCTPDDHAELFHATAGGMGLTGLILDASIRLKKIHSALIEETTLKARNLDEALDLFAAHRGATYSVAWIDCLSSGRSMGRSLISLGEHADEGALQTAGDPKLAMPVDLPGLLLNKYSIRAFNTLYYHRAGRPRQTRKRHYDGFFYPLDSIANWNRMYGRSGFVQYQFVVPRESGALALRAVMDRIVRSQRGSFLAVLKTLGAANANPLSFPMEGHTLALDFKLEAGVLELLDELDRIVLEHGGRVYLTKDARLPAATFRAFYPRWNEFRQVRERYGAHRHFHSLQSRRLEL